MTEEPRALNVGAQLIVKKLRQYGASIEPLLDEVGLSLAQVNRNGGWIPWLKLAELYELAAAELNDPCFGLHLGEEEDILDYGPIAYIGLSSQNLGEAILNLQRYVHTATEAWEIELEVEDDDAVIIYSPALPEYNDYRQSVEGIAGSLMVAYGSILGRPLQPKEVHFIHSFDSDAKEHAIILGCPVKFQQNQNRIILNRPDLALPIETADSKLLKILTDLCDQVYKKRTSEASKLVAQIHEKAINLLPKGKATGKCIAPELGMTERTMHRKLAEEGISFKVLIDDLRRDLAQNYIKEDGLNLSQVAFLLGFASHSGFSTAFKRWTGKTPREARSSTGDLA